MVSALPVFPEIDGRQFSNDTWSDAGRKVLLQSSLMVA